ncbi:hypothetical protein Dimus_036056 [Dionaea muscipula]
MNRDKKQANGPQCRATKERAQSLAEGPQEPKYDPITRIATWKTTEEAFEHCKEFLKPNTADWLVYLKQLARMNQYHSESSRGSVNQENAGMKKGITVRAHYKVRYLLAASALSMFSKIGVSTHNKVRYLKEVEAVWEMGQAIGLEADGKDEMIIQKIMELEEADDRDKDVGTEKVG